MSSVLTTTQGGRGPLTELLTGGGRARRLTFWLLGGLVVISLVRVISGEQALTSSSTMAAALLLAVPIGLAALGALLFAFLDRALVPLQIADYPASVITIIQGTIVLAVVVANEIARRIIRRSAERGTASPAGGPAAGDGSTGPVQSTPPGGSDERQGAQA